MKAIADDGEVMLLEDMLIKSDSVVKRQLEAQRPELGGSRVVSHQQNCVAVPSQGECAHNLVSGAWQQGAENALRCLFR